VAVSIIPKLQVCSVSHIGGITIDGTLKPYKTAEQGVVAGSLSFLQEASDNNDINIIKQPFFIMLFVLGSYLLL
jgi:hypothetical protein